MSAVHRDSPLGRIEIRADEEGLTPYALELLRELRTWGARFMVSLPRTEVVRDLVEL